LFVSMIAVRNEKLSSTIATLRTSTGTQCQLSIPCGSLNLCHASYSAKIPPTKNSTTATMNA
jgi:hypothetical protein